MAQLLWCLWKLFMHETKAVSVPFLPCFTLCFLNGFEQREEWIEVFTKKVSHLELHLEPKPFLSVRVLILWFMWEKNKTRTRSVFLNQGFGKHLGSWRVSRKPLLHFFIQTILSSTSRPLGLLSEGEQPSCWVGQPRPLFYIIYYL